MLLISTAKLVSALALCSTLTGLVLADGPRNKCVVTYRASRGDTCESIASGAGVGLPVIQSLNSGLDCSVALTAGDELCTRMYQPVCTLNSTATSTMCSGLAGKWNLTTTQFVDYNENVNDACSNLVPGKTYCVSINECYPGNTAPICQQ